MKYKDFSSDLTSKIKSHIELKSQNQEQLIAAFDADGTLWDTDIGEAFFQYLIDSSKIELPSKPWQYYHNLKSQDPISGYYWLAQILKGQPLSLVRTWAQEAIEQQGSIPIFPSQRWLINHLKDNNCQIFIVTASIKWAVEPAARTLGIPESHVIGIETEIDSKGLVTDNRVLPPTYKEGKAAALLKKTNGIRPILSCGNSTGDTALLEIADLKLAVKSSAKQEGLESSEKALQQIATQNRWLTHTFT